ncbi:MAG TPA: TPM domain-containing protein [Verrucomicrobiae bacterium]|nr:TPM domain-containing protein [Verrucomicrobiae bacterium]
MNRAIAILLFVALGSFAADRIPPTPTRYFTQYTQLVSPATAEGLNQKLEEFEKKTSSQILVAIFPRLPEGAALEDFTVRTAQAWKVGRTNDNGAVLFIFVADRKIRIEVGYGLEGAIPDATAKRIIDDEIRPRFQQRDMEGGVVAGVNALIQAAQGEYRGTGTTVAQRGGGGSGRVPCGSGIFLAIILILVFSAMARRLGGGTMYHRRMRRHAYWGTPWITMGGWGGSSGGRGGGWSSGGFSGGGGRFGGGGASGSW